MSNVIETAAVRGLTIELVPGRQWRQAAKSGRKSMNYRISGTIGTPAGDVFINAYVGAVGADGEVHDLVDGSQFVTGLLAKDDPQIDSLKLAYGTDGKPVCGADGLPAYAEDAVIQDDGRAFPSFFGTLWLVQHAAGKRVVLHGVTLSPTGREVTAGTRKIPVASAAVAGISLEDAVVAAGAPLKGVKIGVTAGTQRAQAARKTAAADPAGQELPG